MEAHEKKNLTVTKRRSLLLVLFLLLLALLGISYAFLKTTLFGEKKVSFSVGTLNVQLEETSEGLTIVDAAPMYDEEGSKLSAYHFSIENTSTMDASYQIYLDNDVASCTGNCTFLEDQDIKYQLTKGSQQTIRSLAETRNIEGGILKAGQKISYEFRMWLNIDASNGAMGKVFYGKIRVEATQNITAYDPDSSSANVPELASNMIPVKYDGYKWVKAANDKSWYNYDQQIWANAVTVSESSRSTYLNAAIDTEIKMSDINTMWVWIPRYSYTIASHNGTSYYGKKGIYLDSEPTLGLPGEIDIKFISTSTKDTGTAQYVGGGEPKNWRTPDGFTFGSQELSGIWYAKFETSNLEGQYTSNSSNLTPIVKPKVTSWRNIQVANLETASMSMTKTNNIYGFSSSEVDSHASKNSEWATVAYLSQSKYGKLGNRSYSKANK